VRLAQRFALAFRRRIAEHSAPGVEMQHRVLASVADQMRAIG